MGWRPLEWQMFLFNVISSNLFIYLFEGNSEELMLEILRAVLFEIVGWIWFYFFLSHAERWWNGEHLLWCWRGFFFFLNFNFIIAQSTSYDKMVLRFRIRCKNHISDLWETFELRLRNINIKQNLKFMYVAHERRWLVYGRAPIDPDIVEVTVRKKTNKTVIVVMNNS